MKLFAVPLITILLLTAVPFQANASQLETVRILHTNDIHGRIVPGEGMGFSKLKTLIDQYCQEDCLLLDAGDMFHGTPFVQASKGAAVVSLMNDLHYDAFVPGNHDFNYGLKRLLTLQKQAHFTFLNGNIFYQSTNQHVFTPYMIKTVANKRVGVFGLTTTEAFTKTNPIYVNKLEISDPYAQAREMIKQLKDEQVDIIVALVHLGVEGSPETSQELAKNVEGIDIIVDGHSHTTLEKGLIADHGTLISSTGAHLHALGLVTLTFPTHESSKKNASLLKDRPTLQAHSGIQEKLQTLLSDINDAGKKMVAFTHVHLDGERKNVRTDETNFTQFISDAMREQTEADAALINGGAIRASIEKGQITQGDLQSALPFDGQVVTANVTGKQLKQMIEFGVDAYPAESGKFPHISGMSATFHWHGTTRRLSSLLINNKAVDDSTYYTLATTDFIINGGDGYPKIQAAVRHKHVRDLVVDHFQNHQPYAQKKSRLLGLET
ncbi:bifunctional UDP-sugar hydrolase/5'-nucleotidase [Shouchella sp. JSM 1781072]|uniref:bifunctional metallophosphatase/5'-nucleotidase n=1 Tax=Bacillaceae TaxID=186817 RepID=UPI0020D080B2|nr:bifunctional UDP-sugar hydrolase/5'-nucleotidase [Alkalihalobacillus sp. LMS6]UTR07444.1 bifunctional metallophosphatase/5'-nucleotidase [Alkalihalobacillus sp. LMS6]